MTKAICHITHVSHLPTILGDGGLWCDKEAAARGRIKQSIAHDEIKQRRLSKTVPCGAGGTLADYVPFYFAPRSPMLGAIHVGKVPAYRDGQENIVHLVSSTKSVAEAGVSFVFTDGHAVMAISRFFTDLQDLDRIDWDVVSVEQKHWFDTQEDPDRLRRRQAEFLVRDFFPWPLITQIGVMTERVAETVREALAATEHRPPVIVRGTKWYFEPRDADMYRQKP